MPSLVLRAARPAFPLRIDLRNNFVEDQDCSPSPLRRYPGFSTLHPDVGGAACPSKLWVKPAFGLTFHTAVVPQRCGGVQPY